MEKNLVPVEKKILDLFKKKTPLKYIKHRPGGNGRQLSYVPIGYVISELNNNFGPFWEWKLIYQQVFESMGQVAVTGELTVKSPSGFSITKTGSGGSAIKIIERTGKPLSIGWDLESASQLALKKAASKFGIAADVFYKEIDQYEKTPELVNGAGVNEAFIKQQLMKKFFAIAAPRGFDGEKAKELIKNAFNVLHMENLTVRQLEQAVNGMEIKYQIVPEGEKPLKIGELRIKPDGVMLPGEVIENPEEVEEITI